MVFLYSYCICIIFVKLRIFQKLYLCELIPPLIIKMLKVVEMKRRSERCSLMTQEIVGVGQKGKILVIEYLIVLTVLLVLVAILVRN